MALLVEDANATTRPISTQSDVAGNLVPVRAPASLDVGTATSGGASIPIAAGSVFMTPSGYKPAGAVSLWGGATGQAFAARRW